MSRDTGPDEGPKVFGDGDDGDDAEGAEEQAEAPAATETEPGAPRDLRGEVKAIVLGAAHRSHAQHRVRDARRVVLDVRRDEFLHDVAQGRVESPDRSEVDECGAAVGQQQDVPGVQVAVISRRSDGYYLAQVDGDQAARLNGTPLAPHAVALHAHDVLDIAGIKLEFFFQV